MNKLEWWKTATIYNIFPLSFCDSNGDGYGDLGGILARLDYLEWLGVDALWLGPIFTSPLVDAGYDISDFCDIDPRFGSLQTFDRLLDACHRRSIRVILDIAPNHTSDQHPWFLDSRSSRTSAKRDWYVWRDARPDGSPPNNWVDNMQTPAWAWDEATGQYFYHRFLPSQPDLNFRHPEVVQAMRDVLGFWLKRGVDGFRIDAATHLVEDELLRDEPAGALTGGPPGWMDRLYTSERAESHAILAALREELDRYLDRLMIGESVVPIGRLMNYYGRTRPELHLPVNSQLMKTEPWSARRIDAGIDQYMMLLPDDGWPCWQLDSHDVPRTASRIGAEQARVAALLALTLPGTAFIYNGNELGLKDLAMRPDQVRDPYFPTGKGRDPYRSPMPWTNDRGAGFTDGEPWLPLAQDDGQINVQAQTANPRSMLHLCRRLIALRKAEPALAGRDFRPSRGDENLVAYERPHEAGALLIVANVGARPTAYRWQGRGEILLSTYLDRDGSAEGKLDLRPDEGLVLRLR